MSQNNIFGFTTGLAKRNLFPGELVSWGVDVDPIPVGVPRPQVPLAESYSKYVGVHTKFEVR